MIILNKIINYPSVHLRGKLGARGFYICTEKYLINDLVLKGLIFEFCTETVELKIVSNSVFKAMKRKVVRRLNLERRRDRKYDKLQIRKIIDEWRSLGKNFNPEVIRNNYYITGIDF